MRLGLGRFEQVVGAVACVVVLAWLLTRYVEQPAYRVLTQLAVPLQRLGFRAFSFQP